MSIDKSIIKQYYIIATVIVLLNPHSTIRTAFTVCSKVPTCYEEHTVTFTKAPADWLDWSNRYLLQTRCPVLHDSELVVKAGVTPLMGNIGTKDQVLLLEKHLEAKKYIKR